MNKRAIYIGIPLTRIGPRQGEVYIGYGMTGEVITIGGNIFFHTDDGEDWLVKEYDLYFPRT